MHTIRKCWQAEFWMAVLIFVGSYLYPTIVLSAEPSVVVNKFHAVLLSVMKTGAKTTVKSRYKRLEPEINNAFNLPFMIRVITGSRWKRASHEEKINLTDAFRRMSVGTYAARFNSYSGQSFKTLKVRNGPKNTRLVDTQLESPGDRPVKLTYVMRKFGNHWKITDVLLDQGISEMAMRASEYRAILRSRGPGALAMALNKKAGMLIQN